MYIYASKINNEWVTSDVKLLADELHSKKLLYIGTISDIIVDMPSKTSYKSIIESKDYDLLSVTGEDYMILEYIKNDFKLRQIVLNYINNSNRMKQFESIQNTANRNDTININKKCKRKCNKRNK